MRESIQFAGCLVGVLVLVLGGSAAPTPSSAHVQFREPRAAGYLLEGEVAGATGLKSSAVPQAWLKAWPDNGSTNFVEFGSRVVIQVGRDSDLAALLQGRPLQVSRKLAEGLYILQAPDAATAIRQAESLARNARASAAHPVTRRRYQMYGAYAAKPNDPYFAEAAEGTFWQANLENRDTNGTPLGIDLNARAAWASTRGERAVMAIADDGIELDHPDLAERTAGAPHFNFLTAETNGMPSGTFSYHATAVAGLAAATGDNQRGVTGVAPRARLASWVIFGAGDNLANEEALMDMFQYQSNIVSVQNHSWGKVGAEQLRLSSLEDLAISNAVTLGRSGRGVVLVRAAGNGRLDGNDVNEDGYAADPRVVAVAAVRLDGKVARYSSPGACILVAAPSGDKNGTPDPCLSDSANLVTTDRQGVAGYNRSSATDGSADYAFGETGFSGTSGATPQITGVVALILSANTNLTSRDVQQLLIHSSRHYDLSDPTLVTNSAGFRVSHNLGFGVPDAGMAVDLARRWSNRPPPVTVTYAATNTVAVPDLGLRVLVQGLDVPDSLQSIPALPSSGPHPDRTTESVPLVDVGAASNAITADLQGKAALIQRGGNYFCEKISLAAQAGAQFAVIYNNRAGDARVFMAETDLTHIPAVFVRQAEGEALRDYLAADPRTQVQLGLQTTNYTFDVQETLQCEFVGVRLDSDHTGRGDLRMVLTSPAGTRSVLQVPNQDKLSGPHDWTYYSVQHFYESSYGRWILTVSDENDLGTGSILSASLILSGVPIVDTDHDGLDDDWEMRSFNTLQYGPLDDPDHDGYINSRESIMGTNPARPDAPLQLDLAVWNARLVRLSWPSDPNTQYRIQIGSESAAPLSLATNIPGQFRQTEWFAPYTNLLHQFFKLEAVSKAQ